MIPTAPNRTPSVREPLNPVALKLGYAGLAPFVLGALLSLAVWDEVVPAVMKLMAGYAAVIISFLGGIHWGVGMKGSNVPSPTPFAWSAIVSFLAWMAVIMPPHAGLVIDGLLLIGCYLYDRKTYPGQGLGGWLTLRFRLTVFSVLACFLAAARVT